MTGKPAKNFHGVGIGPLSRIMAVNRVLIKVMIGEYLVIHEI